MDSSPLALLAQTCNAIGLPDPPAPTNAKNGSGKSSKNDSKMESQSAKHSIKEESKMASHKNHNHSESTSDTSVATDRRSTSSAHSDHHRKSENRSRNSTGRQSNHSSDTKTLTASESSESTTKTVASSISSAVPVSNKCHTTNGNPITLPPAYPPAIFPPYFPSTSTASSGAFPFGHLPPLPLTTGGCFPSFPPAPAGAPSWMASPPSSLPGFQPKCSDPFCKTCPAIAATAMRAGAGACGMPGCMCSFGGPNVHNDLSSFWLSYGSLFGLHGTTNPATSNPLLAAASAYAATAAATSSAPGQHTCSWMSGSEFCGKRFATADELLQHLKTHTSMDASKAPSIPMAPPGPGRFSPRATSYLNTLNSFRFHPYANNKFSPSSSAAAAAAALASLQFPPAFNPQAFCGSLASQRLPGTLPHP